MRRSAAGAFVISWEQIEVDGRYHVPPEELAAGCSWRWHGEPMRVDGPDSVLPLGPRHDEFAPRHDPLLDNGFVLTDGRQEWHVAVIETAAQRLCLFDRLPPAPGVLLWVAAVDWVRSARYLRRAPPQGVICFTPGTRIRTAQGEARIEDLREGDMIQTRDNGAQPICWIGQKRLSGARLRAMPELAPVRLRGGALGLDIPEGDLLVSPDHRLILRGARAQALFSTDEVLVTARDLVDDRAVRREYAARLLVYIHMALPRHEVIFANGVPCESFHPLSAGLTTLDDEDRARLLAALPDLEQGEAAYGPYARRLLGKAEAAILRGDAGLGLRAS